MVINSIITAIVYKLTNMNANDNAYLENIIYKKCPPL